MKIPLSLKCTGKFKCGREVKEETICCVTVQNNSGLLINAQIQNIDY